jgi:hypothetical protein
MKIGGDHDRRLGETPRPATRFWEIAIIEQGAKAVEE